MSTIISAIIIIAVLALIIWLFMAIHKNNQEKKAAGLRIQFNELALKNNLVVTETEIMHDLLFGIDELYGKLLVVETTGKNRYRHRIIELDNVTTCTLQKSNRAVYENGNAGKINEVVVEEVKLLFEFTGKRTPFELVFYRNVIDYIFELPHLETKAIHWQQLISKKIQYQLKRIA